MLYAALYPFAALLALAFDIASKFLLNWIVAAFADSDGNLPRGLKWFQTFDATLYQGMYARRKELAAGSGDKWAAFDPYPKSAFARYKNRALWLFRNTGYGFDYYLLGVAWNPQEWRVVRFIDNEKLVFFFAIGRGFNLYIESRYGMYKLGWKAWNLFDRNAHQFSGTWGDGGKIPLTVSANPFKRKG